MRRTLIATAILVTTSFLAAAQEPHILEKMAYVFEGSPSRSQVQRAVYNLLQTYDLSTSDSNAEEVGDVMVTLRKASGVPEMDIIECATIAGAKSVEIRMTFRETSAFCATMMSNR